MKDKIDNHSFLQLKCIDNGGQSLVILPTGRGHKSASYTYPRAKLSDGRIVYIPRS